MGAAVGRGAVLLVALERGVSVLGCVRPEIAGAAQGRPARGADARIAFQVVHRQGDRGVAGRRMLVLAHDGLLTGPNRVGGTAVPRAKPRYRRLTSAAAGVAPVPFGLVHGPLRFGDRLGMLRRLPFLP